MLFFTVEQSSLYRKQDVSGNIFLYIPVISYLCSCCHVGDLAFAKLSFQIYTDFEEIRQEIEAETERISGNNKV